MGKDSAIEWTDHTFNPWWGCTKVSPGCQHCYADTVSSRFGHNVWGVDAPRRFFDVGHWNDPLGWEYDAGISGKRQRVFCGSMCDVFEGRLDLIDERERLWRLIGETPSLDWLLLTKRPENVSAMVPWADNWPDNVWLGVSVENQKFADDRLSILVEIPAEVRFISAEPLLGKIDLRMWLPEIDWVIAGGESGAQARPMHPFWVTNILNDCTYTGTAFFFKQWGEWMPTDYMVSGYVGANGKKLCLWSDGRTDEEWSLWDDPDGIVVSKVGKKKAGRRLYGKEYSEFPRGI